jgi:methionyl-tRNA formyltransferase
VHRAILAGDAETGVTIMRVVRELDAGPMLSSVRVPIGPDQTTGQVEPVLAECGAALLVEAVTRLAEGPVAEEPQSAAGVTYADRITKDDAPVFWWRPAGELHNQVRALNPWPLASTTLEGSRLLVVETEIGTEAAPAGALPGTVLAAQGDRFVVAAGHGTLRLKTVKPEGKRAMAAREFLAGHRVAPGTVLG